MTGAVLEAIRPPSISAASIFVYGSRLDGKHSTGRAKDAVDFHGAVEGISKGRNGRAFGIPVRDEKGKPLTIPQVYENVLAFLRYADRHRELTFEVTLIGCGLSGPFSPRQIRPMFREATENVILPPHWRRSS